jgi:hypothetical protein
MVEFSLLIHRINKIKVSPQGHQSILHAILNVKTVFAVASGVALLVVRLLHCDGSLHVGIVSLKLQN